MVLLISLIAQFSEADSGGTDSSIKVEGTSGGSHAWNDTHGFLLTEEDEKVDEAFNITLSEGVKWDSKEGKYKPTGHIFGELHDIHWDDTPEPHIQISEEDFEDYKQEEDKLTVYILAEYNRNGDEERQAYKDIDVERENNPPTAIGWVAVEGEWAWVNLSENNNVTYYVEKGEAITLWFNGSESWDPDGDEVTDWKWDLDEDGNFGEAGENGVNKSRVFAARDSYDLGLMVADERGKMSNSLGFRINVKDCGSDGGTDENIDMNGDFGGSGHHDWLDMHGFVIIDNGEKVDEEFNVTICETLVLIDDSWEPAGYIFGELEGIHWTDDPEPHIQLSEDDFEEYKDDDGILRVFVYGEYMREQKSDTERRYAYLRKSTERPNIAPTAVPWIAEEGNWSWTNMSEEDEVTYYIGDRENITLAFNGSHSWDQDRDEITRYLWDLDDDGSYGNSGNENGENCSMTLDPGTYDLGLIVGDGNKYSPIAKIRVRVVGKGEEGGTDQHIALSATSGNESSGGDDYSWNDIHGFAISEDEVTINDPFNVTICEDIRWTGELWIPEGYDFGGLVDILHDDEPLPVITISKEVFLNHSDDGSNLTFYILSEYYTESRGESERRQAFLMMTITRENDPPVAVAWITHSDKDDVGYWGKWKNVTHDEEIEFFLKEEGSPVKFILNASLSWDPDNDVIGDYHWDLDGDGTFGQESKERSMNTTIWLGEGEYTLGLMVMDDLLISEILTIRIRITIYPEYGASDNDVEVFGEQGDNLEYQWNEIHSLTMYDMGSKIDDEFDITLCSDITRETGPWQPDSANFSMSSTASIGMMIHPRYSVSPKLSSRQMQMRECSMRSSLENSQREGMEHDTRSYQLISTSLITRRNRWHGSRKKEQMTGRT